MKFDPKQKIYILAETGAIGDTICTFPILKILAERGHLAGVFVDDYYMPLYELVFPEHKHLLIRLHDAVTIIPKDQVTPDIPRHVIDPNTGEAKFLSYPLIPNLPVIHTQHQGGLTSIHAHLIDGFSSVIANAILKEDEKSYPLVDSALLPQVTLPPPSPPPDGGNGPQQHRPYVVIAYGATTLHRRMLSATFSDLKRYFHIRGVDVVLLGNSNHVLNIDVAGNPRATTRPSFDGCDTTGCINLIDKTTIPEALSVMASKQCWAVLGVDGGLLHLAALTNTTIIAGYTTVDPYYRLPYRNGVKGQNVFIVEPDSECRYCQTNTFCTYGMRFDVCNIGRPECMMSLTTDKWIRQIERALPYAQFAGDF